MTPPRKKSRINLDPRDAQNFPVAFVGLSKGANVKTKNVTTLTNARSVAHVTTAVMIAHANGHVVHVVENPKQIKYFILPDKTVKG